MKISASDLVAAVRGLGHKRATALVPGLFMVMGDCYLDTPERLAMFLAQVGHESGSFRYVREIWGPTPQQLRYEPPGTLAMRLGNTEPGDGRRFLGRGFIQVTGRANYRACGQALGLPLEERPELLEIIDNAWRSAGWYWTSRQVNAMFDKPNTLERVTRAINGGLNGLDDRRARYQRALAHFGGLD